MRSEVTYFPIVTQLLPCASNKLLEVSFMGAQNVLALTAKRTEFLECIRLLEAKPVSSRSIEDDRLMERLRLKLEWLNKSIELEQQQSEPITESAVRKTGRSNAA